MWDKNGWSYGSKRGKEMRMGVRVLIGSINYRFVTEG